jgi:Fe-only nitrogenase accessory protein AnfO
MISFAVFLNREMSTSSSLEEGIVRVFTYDLKNDLWHIVRDIEFSLVNCSSIFEFREKISGMIARIGDCKVFIAKEVKGQLYSVLEAYRFSIYEVDGKPEQFLSSILALETNNKEIATESPTYLHSPVKTSVEGNYYLNLKEMLDKNPELSSKKVLLPFLTEKNFKELEVICDHIPKWLNEELKKQGMTASEGKVDGNIKLMICTDT